MMISQRPKLKIKYDLLDYVYEIIGIIGLFLLIFLPLYYFGDLPDKIPSHFNAYGEPDAWSKKPMIWLMPIFGLKLYIMLTVLNRYPHIFNYPVKVTEENARKVYSIATGFMRLLKVVIILIFVFLNYKTILIGLNEAEDLGELSLPMFLVIIFSLISVMIYRMIKAKN